MATTAGSAGGELELGLDTFGDVTYGPDGDLLPQPEVLRNVVAEAELADRLGIDFIGVGEHHRPDLAVSSPEVVLAAIAGRTERIRLGSAVTVLSTDDPVRVFERFATLDAVSGGRAEVILGRGSFIESYALFGFDLADYEVLFEERLSLFVELLKEGPVTWSGATRAPLTGERAYPTTSGGLRTWVGSGGSPGSVVRAARFGLPLVLAIIGGQPRSFYPLVDLYRRTLADRGHEPLPVAVHSPGYVAETDRRALDEMWPHLRDMYHRIGRERGWSPLTHEQYEAMAGPDGAMVVGSPDTVAAKIAGLASDMGLSRFDLKYSTGTMPHDQLMSCIELCGTEVVHRVRERLASG